MSPKRRMARCHGVGRRDSRSGSGILSRTVYVGADAGRKPFKLGIDRPCAGMRRCRSRTTWRAGRYARTSGLAAATSGEPLTSGRGRGMCQPLSRCWRARCPCSRAWCGQVRLCVDADGTRARPALEPLQDARLTNVVYKRAVKDQSGRCVSLNATLPRVCVGADQPAEGDWQQTPLTGRDGQPPSCPLTDVGPHE